MPEVCWNRTAELGVDIAAAGGRSRGSCRRSPAGSRSAAFDGLGQVLRPLAAGRSGTPLNELSSSAMASSAPSISGTSRASRSTSERRIPSATARLVAPRHRRPVHPQAAAQLGVQLVQHRLAGRVDEQPVQCGERLVPGGARACPVGRQRLVALDDLLHQHVPVVDQLGQVGAGSRPGRRARPGGRSAVRRPSRGSAQRLDLLVRRARTPPARSTLIPASVVIAKNRR